MTIRLAITYSPPPPLGDLQLSYAKSPIHINSFLPKTLFKNLFFRKLFSTFYSSHKFQFFSEEFWESTYKSPYSRSHKDSRLIGLIVITQRERLYKNVFGLKRSCTRYCCLLRVKRVVNIWQITFAKFVQLFSTPRR